jgi:nucleotide-binding universal stress UspA family protein
VQPDSANTKLEVTIYGGQKNDGGRKNKIRQTSLSQISYKIQTGRPSEDEIINVAEIMNIDLIIMASSKTTSIKVHGSTTKGNK